MGTIIEFEKKPCAMNAMQRCQEGSFFLTASLRPVVVELFDDTEDDDGLMEKNLFKKSQEFGLEREVGILLVQSLNLANAEISWIFKLINV